MLGQPGLIGLELVTRRPWETLPFEGNEFGIHLTDIGPQRWCRQEAAPKAAGRRSGESAKATGWREEKRREVENVQGSGGADIRFSRRVYLASASRQLHLHLTVRTRFMSRMSARTLELHNPYRLSADSRFLQSNDGAYEILYWDGLGSSRPRPSRCVKTRSSSLGHVCWDGLFRESGPYSDGTDINALCRSQSELYCVAGDDSFQVNFYTWPA